MALNIERLTQLRDHIAALDPGRFNMAEWAEMPDEHRLPFPTVEDFVHNCNSVACIGGWADALFQDPKLQLQAASIYHPTNGTYALLGLTQEQGDQLCYPGVTGGLPPAVTYGDITTAHAVETLTKLIETGKVDWSHVRA